MICRPAPPRPAPPRPAPPWAGIAGIAVFDRSPDGRLGAVRIYDDVQPPG